MSGEKYRRSSRNEKNWVALRFEDGTYREYRNDRITGDDGSTNSLCTAEWEGTPYVATIRHRGNPIRKKD